MALIAPAIIATVVTFAARMGRRKTFPDFQRWMEVEGVPIFTGVWLTFFLAFAFLA